MNVFILDKDLKKNAEYYCDKHLVKIILEIAQVMCTVSHEYGLEAPYRPTHSNHPITKWLKENGANWDILVDLSKELNEEYKYRFERSHNHKSYDVITSLQKPRYTNNEFTGMFNSVTDEVRRTSINETIKYYRQYYIEKTKTIDMKWTKRKIPTWISD